MIFKRRRKRNLRIMRDEQFLVKNNNYKTNDSFLVKGNTGKKVEELQEKLQKLSNVFPSLPIVIVDGYYGEITRKTVKMFQELNSIPITGDVDELTWKKINYYVENREINNNKTMDDIDLSDNVVKLGSKGKYVSDLQNYLNIAATKFNNIPTVNVDGFFGNKTLQSVLAFQKEFGLTTDGVVGSVTWDALYKVSIDEPVTHSD